MNSVIFFFIAFIDLFLVQSVFQSKNITLGNPAQGSLGFYYGYFASRDVGTNALAVPGAVETIFGGNIGNEPISIPGAGTSLRMKPADTCTTAAECVSYDNIINALNAYNYVHIDEVSYNHPCPECASVIEQVGNTPGYGARIIVFFRYATSGKGLDSQTSIIDLGMRGYLRKIFFEAYPSDHTDCGNYICTSTQGSACSKLMTWKSDIANVYSGSNILFAPTYDLRSGVGLDICSQDMDALTSYFSCQHNSANDLTDWKGAAFFAPSDCTGCSSYSIQTAATHCGGLLSWWNGK